MTIRHPSLRLRALLSTLGVALVLAGGVFPAPVSAQEKRPLEIADYRLWRSIEGATLSDDGRWIAWSYSRIRSDDTLHVRSADGAITHAVARASEPTFSDDGRWVSFVRRPPWREAEELDREGDPIPLEGGLLSLETGEERSWEDVEDLEFAPGGSHLLVRRTPSDEDADHDGTDVLLVDLGTGRTELIGSVNEAAFDDDGRYLALTVDAADMEGNGLHLIDLESNVHTVLDDAKARYARLTWSEAGDALAVLRGTVPDSLVERENTLLAFRRVGSGTPARTELDADAGLPDGWILSEKGAIRWAEGEDVLFVATRPQSEELEEWPEDGLPLADVNIWHWADDRIQSEQQASAGRDRNRSWIAAAHFDDPRLVPLTDTTMATAEITRDGRWAIGRDARDYVSDWKPGLADHFRVDTRTGARIPVLEAHERTLGVSPDSENWLYWKDGEVWNYRIAEDRHLNLTAATDADFVDREWDYFGERPPYGVAGWTEDGEGVVVYDRYDVWFVPLDGSPGTNLTGGVGAAEEIRLRVVWTDEEARTIDLDRPVLLDGFGTKTKDEGFFRLAEGELDRLNWEPRRFGYPQKAAEADRFLLTAQSWTEFPDLHLVDGDDFPGRTRVTSANPQQDEFLWGRRILFDYELADGTPLQGTLAVPEGWEAGDAPLPMVVRFYEKYSQDLHAYPTPAYRHQPNFAGYVSRGYLLMQPDVHFRVGSSHSDMLEAVEAATQAVIDMGYADPGRIGLSGHSYSGGGGAYIATRSDMFAAIAHGAAPINLVSEFNQLFVGSGQNNHGYDIYGQGRYATNPYDDFDLYWDQSPISGVEEMDTPVLYLHGEDDPVVNWEQGLEWYNALRFLDKPVIWLSYPGEGHGLRRLENRIDFQYRLKQFFDHHLKGDPAPTWMTDGVPFLDKDRHLRQFAPRIFVGDGEGEGGAESQAGSGGVGSGG